MTDGVSPNSASLSRTFLARVNVRTASTPQAGPEATPPETATPPADSRGAETTSLREYNLLDLGRRRFAQLLPQIDFVTAPIE